MKYFWCNDKGAHKHSDGKKHYTANRLNIYSSKSLSASGHPGEWQDGVYGYKCAQNYYRGSTHKIGYVYCLSYKGKFVDTYSSKTYTWLWQANQKRTLYRTVSKKYDYTHWKWGSYSNWSDSYVASNSNRNVQTRTLYRYKIYPKSQTINVDSTDYNKTYGDAPFNLGASASTSLSYESSDPSVASVSSNGTVTIKKSGNAAITIRAAKSIYYKAASKEVTINVAKAGQKIKLNEFFDCDILEHICTPESDRLGAKAKTGLSYSSSNSNVVSVSSNGTVRFKNPGKAKITIRAKSTSKYKSAVRKIAVECVLEKPTMAKTKQNGKIYMSVAFGSYAADTHYIQFKNKDNTGKKSLLKIVEKKENGRPMYYGYKNQNGTWKYKVKSRTLKKISVKVTKKGYYRAVATKKGYSSYTNWVKVN